MKKLSVFILFITLIFPIHRVSAQSEIPIVSESAVLLDSKSGAVLYGKNEHERMYPASLTKIATAIYAIEKGNLTDLVEVPHEAVEVEGTRVYLNEGESVTLLKLIQGMLINSGNDAAEAIAIYLDGSNEQFAKNINNYLRDQIGVKETNFRNPHGLFDPDHYTSAYDLGLMTNYAMKNDVFRTIFGTKEFAWDGLTWDTTLYTHHLMLKGEIPFDGVTGGKTGFVNESGQTLATTASNDKIELTAICLKANYKRDIYNDTMNLLTYGFSTFRSNALPIDTSFVNGESKYRLSSPLFVTEPLGKEATFEVSSEGELIVRGENEEMIQSVSIKEDLLVEKRPAAIASDDEKEKPLTIKTSAILLGFGMSAVAVFVRIRTRKKKHKNLFLNEN